MTWKHAKLHESLSETTSEEASDAICPFKRIVYPVPLPLLFFPTLNAILIKIKQTKNFSLPLVHFIYIVGKNEAVLVTTERDELEIAPKLFGKSIPEFGETNLLVGLGLVEWLAIELSLLVPHPVLGDHFFDLGGVPFELLPVVDFEVDLPVGGSGEGKGLTSPKPKTGDVKVVGLTADNAVGEGLKGLL